MSVRYRFGGPYQIAFVGLSVNGQNPSFKLFGLEAPKDKRFLKNLNTPKVPEFGDSI